MSNDVIAIDGPSASGKSTIAKLLASELKRFYVDSGAIYRAVTWYALEQDVDCTDQEAVVSCMKDMDLVFFNQDQAVCLRVGDLHLVSELRTDHIVENVSAVAANPGVRAQVTAWLRSMTAQGKLVMEGRDIGSTVFPDATFKFFLDADPAERARRRQADAATEDGSKDVNAVLAALNTRDQKDRSRAASPLTITDGAIVVDSTGLGIEDVLRLILDHIAAGA
jgi:cytidylate kinase